MAFGGFARYTIELHPMTDPRGRSLKQSRVCVDGSGVGYLTDAGCFLPSEWLPRDVEEAIRQHAIKERGAAPNMVRLPAIDAVESLVGRPEEDEYGEDA